MKRIGILTLYYRNYNYGGQLQAYALWNVVRNLGYECEQISFQRQRKDLLFRKLKRAIIDPEMIKLIRTRLRIIKGRMVSNFEKEQILRTVKKFDAFIGEIPHSEVVTSETAHNLNEKYDGFIVGSDQVWNPLYSPNDFFFSFLQDDKPRIAYAASIRIDRLEKREERKIAEYLNKFHYISVRENDAKRIIENIRGGVKKQVDIMPDPTVLLSRQEWDKVLAPLATPNKYIFAYLISNPDSLAQIRKYAEKRKWKVVLVANPQIAVQHDDVFVDIKDGIGPREFIYLLKNAELVLANSFHGTVFSLIYNKPFYVYGNFATDNRKKTLLDMYRLQNRMIPDDYDFTAHTEENIEFTETNMLMEMQRIDAIHKLQNVIAGMF